MVEITGSVLKRANDKRMSGVGFNSEFPAIEPQENIADKERCTFVSVHKSMIADQGLKQRGRHVCQICVVPCLWSKQGGFQQAHISQAQGAAKFFN